MIFAPLYRSKSRAEIFVTLRDVRCRLLDAGSVQQRLDSGLEREAWEYKNEYESVSVLVLYWQESDNPGFEKEGHDVGNFFDQRCCYTVEYFPIPSKDSYMWLDDKLNDFWKNYGGKNRLIIIHYGGHGDEDISGGKKAVWAASVFQVASLIRI